MSLVDLRKQVETVVAANEPPAVCLCATPLDDGKFRVQGGFGYKNGVYDRAGLDELDSDPKITKLIVYTVVE